MSLRSITKNQALDPSKITGIQIWCTDSDDQNNWYACVTVTLGPSEMKFDGPLAEMEKLYTELIEWDVQ